MLLKSSYKHVQYFLVTLRLWQRFVQTSQSDTLSSAHPRPAAAVAPLVFVPKHVAIGLRVNPALLINMEL